MPHTKEHEEEYGGGYYTRPHDEQPGAYLDVYNPLGKIQTPEEFAKVSGEYEKLYGTPLDILKLPSKPVTGEDLVRDLKTDGTPVVRSTEATRAAERQKEFMKLVGERPAKPTPSPEDVTRLGKAKEERTQITTRSEEILAERMRLQEEFKKFQRETGQGISMRMRGGLIGQKAQEIQDQLDVLNREELVLETKLQNRNTVISEIMGMGRQDYMDALNEYNSRFTQAFQLYTLLDKGDDEMKTNAKASIDVLSKTYEAQIKSGNITADSISPVQQATLEELELQAERPLGSTMAILRTLKPDETQLYAGYDKDTGTFTYVTKDSKGRISTKQAIIGGGAGAGAELKGVAEVADLVGGFSSVNAQKMFMKSIERLNQTGNDKAIAEKIVGQALDNIADSDTRKRVTGGFKISQSLTRLEELLNEYESRGGETGLIKGNFQKIEQKLGQVGDPELANIGTQILNTLDILARSRTGAVITLSEEKLYNRILPAIDKVGELNLEIINGLRDSLLFDVETSLRFMITEEGFDVLKNQLPDVFKPQQERIPESKSAALDAILGGTQGEITRQKKGSFFSDPLGTIWRKLFGE